MVETYPAPVLCFIGINNRDWDNGDILLCGTWVLFQPLGIFKGRPSSAIFDLHNPGFSVAGPFGE